MSLGTLYKDPQETVIFVMDWSARLADGETISSSSWTVGAGVTQVEDAIVTGNLKTNVKLSGGTPGQTVGCTNTVVTSTGQTLERSGLVAVRSL